MTETSLSLCDDLIERVGRSRAAQGLPPVVVDPAAIDRAAAILRLAESYPPALDAEAA